MMAINTNQNVSCTFCECDSSRRRTQKGQRCWPKKSERNVRQYHSNCPVWICFAGFWANFAVDERDSCFVSENAIGIDGDSAQCICVKMRHACSQSGILLSRWCPFEKPLIHILHSEATHLL